MIKLVDREELMRERQQKRELEAAKAAEKERKKAEAAAKAKALEELKKIPPSEMFRPENNRGTCLSPCIKPDVDPISFISMLAIAEAQNVIDTACF